MAVKDNAMSKKNDNDLNAFDIICIIVSIAFFATVYYMPKFQYFLSYIKQ